MIWVQCPRCQTLQGVVDSAGNAPHSCRVCGQAIGVATAAPVSPDKQPATPEDAASRSTAQPPPPLPWVQEVEEPAGTYELVLDAKPVREEGKRSVRRARPSSRDARVRVFDQNWRKQSPRLLIGIFLLMLPPLWVEGFGLGLPLAVKLVIGVCTGTAGGVILYPDMRYSPIGLLCGFLAGLLGPLVLHYYVAWTPPNQTIFAGELVLAWVFAFLPPAGLYYLLLRWAVLRGTSAETTKAENEGPRQLAGDTRVPLGIWKRLLVCLFLFFFASLEFLGAIQAPAMPRRLLLSLGGLVFCGIGIGFLFLRRHDPGDVAYYPRGQRRGFQHSLPILAPLGATWLVSVVALFCISDQNTRLKLMAVIFLGCIACCFSGHIWLGTLFTKDGREFRWLPPIGVYVRINLRLYDPVWQYPKRYARPYWLFMFGCLSFLATFVLVLLRENVWSGAPSAPPQATKVAFGNGAGPVHKPFELGPRDYLSDLAEFDVKIGPWSFGRNGHAGDGQSAIQVNSVPSPKGLGMHPPDAPGYSAVKYHLDKKAAVFKAAVALNDSTTFAFGPAVFEVWGDGKRLWQSAPVDKSKQPPQECRIDVTGVDVLELRVRAQGLHPGLHAVWVEPRVLQKADTPDK